MTDMRMPEGLAGQKCLREDIRGGTQNKMRGRRTRDKTTEELGLRRAQSTPGESGSVTSDHGRGVCGEDKLLAAQDSSYNGVTSARSQLMAYQGLFVMSRVGTDCGR